MNKAEGKQGDNGILESYALGFGDPIAISGEHGEGMADLFQSLLPHIDGGAFEVPDPEAPDAILKLAIVGRPNAGKSTLINKILGENRLITGPEAGITRDSISVDWIWTDPSPKEREPDEEGNIPPMLTERRVRLIDTAGMRKRAKVQEKLERASTMETTHSIRFADVVVLVMDPRDAFEKQDVQIANLVIREGRGLVFALTKWDAVDNPSEARKEMDHQALAHLPHAAGTPLVPVSGITRKNLDKLMDACVKVHKDWSARVKTRDLNDWLAYVTQKHPPPAPNGKRIKPRYMAQMKTRPPTFVLMASRANEMPETYKRYLLNELREAFDLPGVPIRLVLKQGKNPFADKD